MILICSGVFIYEYLSRKYNEVYRVEVSQKAKKRKIALDLSRKTALEESDESDDDFSGPNPYDESTPFADPATQSIEKLKDTPAILVSAEKNKYSHF